MEQPLGLPVRLLSRLSRAAQRGGKTYYGNNQLYGFYGNDIFKVNEHLTLNLGLRYEFQTVPEGIEQQSLNRWRAFPA